jgi:hypothetical protein
VPGEVLGLAALVQGFEVGESHGGRRATGKGRRKDRE